MLGPLELRCGPVPLVLARRKTQALLLILALDGAQRRDTLAEWLWPSSGAGGSGAGGRASLRNALADLNTQCRAFGLPRFSADREWLSGQGPTLEIDLYVLIQASRSGARETPLADPATQLRKLEAAADLWRGDLLAGFSLPDAPDFEAWMLAQRRLAQEHYDALLTRLVRLYAAAGQPEAAIGAARQRVRLEPLNEAAHRQLIECCLLTGDRGRAMDAYRACEAVLEQHLGLAPSPETQACIADLRPVGIRRPAGTPHAQVLTPLLEGRIHLAEERSAWPSAPPLVGREREWAAMEIAWAAGQHIFITGEPGMGKTRLMLDFAASKGTTQMLEGWPGDPGIPYATMARLLRRILGQIPGATLAPWVQREVGRLLPELAGPQASGESAPFERRRLYDAVSEVVALNPRHFSLALSDDLQYFDAQSMAVASYGAAKLRREGRPVQALSTFRRSELPRASAAALQWHVDAGEAVVIDLQGLNLLGTGALLERIGAARLVTPMQRLTGGNPLYILETIRALEGVVNVQHLTSAEFGRLQRDGHLPRSSRIDALIQARLARLSRPARNLARVAAVADEVFTLSLAARVLEADLVALLDAHEELETAGLLRGERFAHDLLRDSVRGSVSYAAQRALCTRLLDLLTSTASAAVLARLAHGAGQPGAAFRYDLAAGEEAFALKAYRDAATHFKRAWDSQVHSANTTLCLPAEQIRRVEDGLTLTLSKLNQPEG
ncbi:BTAD domain-containing putative transcriptional regulator [Deinococcus sp.]|uniref:BTAD domain-containing putative transcriptional regulator n=1 Tax=Deinococcus sp. TaxID=47478 RepID=UPI003CC5CA7A